jgi:hypothetical protein
MHQESKVKIKQIFMPKSACERNYKVFRVCGKYHSISRAGLDLSFLSVKQSEHRSRQFVSSLEEVEFENEDESEKGTSKLGDEIAGCSGRASY